jgi:hypothetical protein
VTPWDRSTLWHWHYTPTIPRSLSPDPAGQGNSRCTFKSGGKRMQQRRCPLWCLSLGVSLAGALVSPLLWANTCRGYAGWYAPLACSAALRGLQVGPVASWALRNQPENERWCDSSWGDCPVAWPVPVPGCPPLAARLASVPRDYHCSPHSHPNLNVPPGQHWQLRRR